MKYLVMLVLFLTSCSVSQDITQRQLLIQKEMDILQINYYYTLDSLYIEYYKKP